MKHYEEIDKGRFESCLLRIEWNDWREEWEETPIAFTDFDVVRVTNKCKKSDRTAVLDFAEKYDLTIEENDIF